MKFKIIFKSTACIWILCVLLPALALAQPGVANQPPVQSRAAVLVEQGSGQVLFEKNADERRAIASTTKIMTALLVLEKLGISQNVVFSAGASRVGGEKINYGPGEQRSSEELLYSLLLLSTNSAATAFAEKISGSEAGFTQMMNLKASQLGAVNTIFANPHGLPSTLPHYSTARDMAVIAAQAMKNPVFRRIVASRDHDFIVAGQPPKRLENINELLKVYPYATGIKTGYTSEAGYCLVASAKRGGLSLVAVILGSRTRAETFAEAAELFEYGFNNYSYRQLVSKKRVYGSLTLPKGNTKVKLVAGQDIVQLVYDQPTSINYKLKMRERLPSNFHKGEKIGKLIVSQFGKEIGRVDLLAGTDSRPSPVKLSRRRGLLSGLRILLALLGL